MSTSSEKYETLQDEVDSLLQRIQEAIRKTEAAAGEEKKKLAQVCERFLRVHSDNLFISELLHDVRRGDQ